MKEDISADISTLIRKITSEEADNPNLVKCVIDNSGYAMYFPALKFHLREMKAKRISTDISVFTDIKEMLLFA